ncbi:MAG: hypothetical protein N2Z72_05225 [Bacteroidales bacterium]|nr:hypothetical protein [Bacteroidales bacterium]
MKLFFFYICFLPIFVIGQLYVFNGNLSDKSITMYVLYTPVGMWGSYYDEESKIPYPLINWEDFSSSNNWKLYKKENNMISEEFNGKFDGKYFKGTWKKGNKELSFNLKQDQKTEKLFETFTSYDKTKYNPFFVEIVYPLNNHSSYSLIEKHIFEGNIQNFTKEKVINRKKYYANFQDIFANEAFDNPPRDFYILYPIYLSSTFIVYAEYFYASLAMEREGYSFTVLSIKNDQPIEIYDIVADEDFELKKLLTERLAKTYSLQIPAEDLSWSEIDFYMTDGGVVFCFPSGFFYPGMYRISLTRKEIEPFLNQFAKKHWGN